MAARACLCLLAATLAGLAGATVASGATYKQVTGKYASPAVDKYYAFMPSGPVTSKTPSRPLVLFIHGNQANPGLWFSSAQAVAKVGGIGVAIEFAWQKPYPGPDQEAHAAIDFLRKQTAWKVDPDRVAVVGSSRGAGVAVRMGFGPYSDHPTAVVGWSGVYDLRGAVSVKASDVSMPCEYLACLSLWEEASPIAQLADVHAIHLANGDKEKIPLVQMTSMDAYAASLGLDHSADVIATYQHGIQLMGKEWPSTLAFLRRVLAF
jgi:pimeloyl-ACP methyl ester carboxylesterase